MTDNNLDMSSVNIRANQLHGKYRKEFWRIFKDQGVYEAFTYHEDVLKEQELDTLLPQLVENAVFGTGFEEGALNQFYNASRLPVAIKSAVMPDAHQGYGLPIGGVLATDNAVIPYAVGVDIGCRMRISIFPISGSPVFAKVSQWDPGFKNSLIKQTRFGMGAHFDKNDLSKHAVLDHADWAAVNKMVPLKNAGSLQDIAVQQLGTSGGGNHFVEWGTVTIQDPSFILDEHYRYNTDPGQQYMALLSHSGSRGVGAKIADYFSKLAMSLRPNLDPNVKHLAWLNMDEEEGQQYWMAMNLAGEFAKANHEVIHRRIIDEMGIAEPIAVIDNHHNFAWIENVTMKDGSIQQAYVHRKGATPAGKGVMGVIPGSMATNGYIVRGKGNPDSINSASHGAGRAMSRKKAHETLSREDWKNQLIANDIELIGGSLDEATNAYKDIETVMASQTELIDIVATFSPRIVRMADDGYVED